MCLSEDRWSRPGCRSLAPLGLHEAAWWLRALYTCFSSAWLPHLQQGLSRARSALGWEGAFTHRQALAVGQLTWEFGPVLGLGPPLRGMSVLCAHGIHWEQWGK